MLHRREIATAFVYSIASCLFSVQGLSRCCPGHVCFNDDPPFNDLPLPQCVEDIKPIMRLFTRLNPTEGQNITQSFVPSVFDGSKLTIFFVPGGTSEKFPPWVYSLKDAALTQGDNNVIIVDWEEKKSRNLSGDQVFSDTRSVGAEIGRIAANLIAEGKSNRSTLYCVGHSAGADVCGIAGTTIKFGRITGLDPAYTQRRDWTIGLNPTCADLVDVIHTNGELLGNPDDPWHAGDLRVLGHIDFYVNGGQLQPGCEEGALGSRCNHMRAIDLYTESLLTPCFLARVKCADQGNLLETCKFGLRPIQSMGFPANTYEARGIFYLRTRGSAPFCLG